MRVEGNFSHDDRVCDGDILVIDRAVQIGNGSIVVVGYKCELVIKRITEREGKYFMSPEVITFVVHKV